MFDILVMKMSFFKFLAALLLLCTFLTAFTGCMSFSRPDEPEPEPEAAAEPLPSGKPYIAVISKDSGHQFWQTVKLGAEEAAGEYGADFSFDGPLNNADADAQAAILTSVLEKNPSAVCIGAVDPETLSPLLEKAKNEGIPVVALETDIDGAAVATASTDNYEAGKLAAESIYRSHVVAERIRSANAANPVTIAVFSYYPVTEAHDRRIQGFLDRMNEIVKAANSSGAQITGHPDYTLIVPEAAVNLAVVVPERGGGEGIRTAVLSALEGTQNQNLIGGFCISQEAADGLLDVTLNGAELDKTTGKYKDLVVIGFNAGQKQKNAVRNQYFYGAITQDPYTMGKTAVELAYDALQGDTVLPETADTGSIFYSYENMDNPDIELLLYD